MAMADSHIANEVPFADLCKLLDGIENTKIPKKRKTKLEHFVNTWRKHHLEKYGNMKTTDGDSFYPAMRLILPSFDGGRGAYGFKEHMLATRLIQILVIGKNSQDAERLLNYRAPREAKRGQAVVGDFAETASITLKSRLPPTCTLSVKDVNDHLDAIAEANANKNQDGVKQELEMLCRSTSSAEMKWIIRILLKQMKLGMQETTVLGVFHDDAKELYDVTTSLLKVCMQLHDPATRLDVIQIQLFAPFRPMLAKSAPPEKVPQLMKEKSKNNEESFYVEIKYDGERVQLHKDGSKYKYFSRNGNEFTTSYGGTPNEGSLTPTIHKMFSPIVKSCILDGEMVGWNRFAECVVTKGDQFDVKSLREGDDLNPCFVPFDVLMLNGEVLTQKELRSRLEVLSSIFSSQDEGHCMLAERHEITSTNELVKLLNGAVDRREEGIVAKRPDSTYKLNTRSDDGGWFKIKPDYVSGMTDDLDVLIVGGYFGGGKRANLMSHFLLAVAYPPSNGQEPEKFVSMCKVGSGYSLKELYDLNVHLNKTRLIRHVPGERGPDWLELGIEKPEVYIEPKNSKILQVRAAAITPTTNYGVGYTLRFPRVEKIRDDKDWKDCMQVADFHTLRETYLSKKHEVRAEEYGGSPSKGSRHREGGGRVRAKPLVLAGSAPADIKDVSREYNTLEGKEFCVITPSVAEKKKLEGKIKEHGGRRVQDPGDKTYCVLSSSLNLHLKNVISARKKRNKSLDVVKPQWLLRCCEERKLLSWTPSDMVHSAPETEKSFESLYDEYGDSYTEGVASVEEMKKLMERVRNKKLKTGTRKRTHDEISAFQEDTFPDYKWGLFRPCRVYVDGELGGGREGASSLEWRVKVFGGHVVSDLDSASHVIVHHTDLSRLADLMKLNRERKKRFHIVTEHWVEQCVNSNKLVEEPSFQP